MLHARRSMLIRMTLLHTERLFRHCGAHTAEPAIGLIRPIPPIPYYQNWLFSVAHGRERSQGTAWYYEGGPSMAREGKGVQRRRLALRGERAACAVSACSTKYQQVYTWPPGVSQHAPGTGRVLTGGEDPGEVKHCDVAVFSCAKRNARGMAWAERAGCAH